MEQQEIQTLRALMEYEAARTAPPESFPDLPDIPLGAIPTRASLNWNKPKYSKSPGSLPRTSMRSRSLAAT